MHLQTFHASNVKLLASHDAQPQRLGTNFQSRAERRKSPLQIDNIITLVDWALVDIGVTLLMQVELLAPCARLQSQFWSPHLSAHRV